MIAVALASVALAAPPDPRRFLRSDARDRVATVTLLAGYDSTNGGFNFDGYARGRLMWTVPKGWTVRVTCTNRSGMRHSCAVVRGAMADTLAFPGAATPSPVIGLLQGRTATFSFRATRTGVFRFTSLVPGQESARMYDILKITRGGKPSVVDLFASP